MPIYSGRNHLRLESVMKGKMEEKLKKGREEEIRRMKQEAKAQNKNKSNFLTLFYF